MTITSPHNEKLKLIRRLRERKHRERERLFTTEGEDLLEAGLASGAEPHFVLVAAGSGLAGEEVEPELLAAASTLGSGTRAVAVWPLLWADRTQLSPHSGNNCACIYLHGVGDPGNVGTIIRTAHALLHGTVVLGPNCADPFSPKATRASMGALFAQPPLRAGVEETPAPRVAMVAHGGGGLDALAGAATVCFGAEREGLPPEASAACEVKATIPLRPGAAESLNVAASVAIACDRLAAAENRSERISSPAMPEDAADA